MHHDYKLYMDGGVNPALIYMVAHICPHAKVHTGVTCVKVCRDKRRHTIELQFIPLHAWIPCRWLVEHHKMIVRHNPLWGSPKLCEEHHIYPTTHERITHKQSQLKPNKCVKRTNYLNNHL